MATLQENMQNMRGKKYVNVKRNDKAYEQARSTTTEELERLLDLYRNTVIEDDMRARLLRDSIDHWIRRYHGYTIGGGIGSHYIQVGVDPRDCIFEHIIPASKIRDMMLAGVLTVPQALNAPTCLISKTNDEVLRRAGHVSTSPSYWHFFDRYNVLTGNTFSVYNGKVIADPHNWTLEQHYKHFGV
jgi:hypothetical protein